MFTAKVQKVGDDFVVTIPDDEASRLNIQEGDIVGVTIVPVELVASPRTELKAALNEDWEQDEPAYRYLTNR